MSWRVSPFQIDVTPRLGDAICGGMCGWVQQVIAPNYLRGLVLDDGRQRQVVAVIDFCYACGRSQRRLEDALARGAGVPRDQVVVQSNHTHAAPAVSEEIHATVKRFQPDLPYHNADWFDDLLARAEEAVSTARQSEAGFDLSGVAFASHAVQDFASSRRVPDGQGGMHVRWSFCQDPHIKAAPVGLIDPMLDLVLLYDATGEARAAMSFYASHPQVGGIQGAIHGDSIGIALDLWRAAHPDCPMLYFDGCGGDITAGKYTGRLAQREVLVFGTRLYDAMAEAHAKARPRSVSTIQWTDAPFDCQLAPVHCTAAEMIAILNRSEAQGGDYWLAAKKLNRIENAVTQHPFRLTRLSIDGDAMLFLPSELVVEYQLYAKRRFQGHLAVAAYGDSYFDYVGTDHMFPEGGYEVEPMWTEVGPGIEGQICAAMDRILA